MSFLGAFQEDKHILIHFDRSPAGRTEEHFIGWSVPGVPRIGLPRSKIGFFIPHIGIPTFSAETQTRSPSACSSALLLSFLAKTTKSPVRSISFDTAIMGLGVTISNGCRIVHGQGSHVKNPFPEIPVTMHELDAGRLEDHGKSYCGQFGYIPFDHSLRLPRHVHIGFSQEEGRRIFVTERILVLNGIALVELNGNIYIIAPGSLVTIRPGVPHTWTACPPGVKLPDGMVSDGKFLMVYEYEELTGFFPTSQTNTFGSVDEYEKYEGSLEDIRFPKLTGDEIVKEATLIWGLQVTSLIS